MKNYKMLDQFGNETDSCYDAYYIAIYNDAGFLELKKLTKERYERSVCNFIEYVEGCAEPSYPIVAKYNVNCTEFIEIPRSDLDILISLVKDMH